VHALANVSVTVERANRRHHGIVGLRQIDADVDFSAVSTGRAAGIIFSRASTWRS